MAWLMFTACGRAGRVVESAGHVARFAMGNAAGLLPNNLDVGAKLDATHGFGVAASCCARSAASHGCHMRSDGRTIGCNGWLAWSHLGAVSTAGLCGGRGLAGTSIVGS